MFGLSKIVLPPEHEYYYKSIDTKTTARLLAFELKHAGMLNYSYEIEEAEGKIAEVLQKLLGETDKNETENNKNVSNEE